MMIRRCNQPHLQEQQQQQQQQWWWCWISWAASPLASALASLLRTGPLLAAAAVAGSLLPGLLAPAGLTSVVRQRLDGGAGGVTAAAAASAPPLAATAHGASLLFLASSPPRPAPLVILSSEVSRVDAEGRALELAFSATIPTTSPLSSAALAVDSSRTIRSSSKKNSTDGADSASAAAITERLLVGVGTFVTLDLDLRPPAAHAPPRQGLPPAHWQQHHFTTCVPMLPSSLAASVLDPQQLQLLPFPFDEWSLVVQVWAAVERCRGQRGGGDGGGGTVDARRADDRCTRMAVPLAWAASFSTRAWRPWHISTATRHGDLAWASDGPDADEAAKVAAADADAADASDTDADDDADAVSHALVRVTLARPAPARVIALLDLGARCLLGGYVAIAAASWAVAALVLGPLLRGAFGPVGGGGGTGGLGGGAVEATLMFSSLD
jgi:hypothetical protein